MRKIGLLICVVLLACCQSLKVYHDYDKQTDFSNYSTYNFYPDIQSGLSQLDERRLFDAIDTELQSKGIRFSEDPDFYVNVKTRFFRNQPNNNVGVGVGGTGRSIGGGVSIGIPVGSSSHKREIRLDFVDSKKDLLFWNVVTESSFKENIGPDKREELLQKVVSKALVKYPPK